MRSTSSSKLITRLLDAAARLRREALGASRPPRRRRVATHTGLSLSEDRAVSTLNPAELSDHPLPSPVSRLAAGYHALSGRGKDVVICLMLALLAMIFPWQLTLLGHLPSSIDFVLQYYPNLAFLGHNLRAGDLPLWNPHVFAGTPYLADPQSGVLYLPNWPFLLLLSTSDAARAIILGHYALAAVGTFLYLRTIGLGRAGALVGAAMLGVSEYTITQVAGIPLLINLAWIPVVLLLVELALQRRSLWYAAGAAMALTLQLFNGWLHGLFITFFALLATFLWHAITSSLSARNPRPAFRSALLMAAMGSIWAALGLCLLLPVIEFAGLSNYVMDRVLEQAGGQGNVTVLALLGVGGSEGHGAYLGATGLLLMMLGILYGGDRKRVWLYLLLGTFSLMTAFGTKAPLYAHLYQWVPGFEVFHTPGRFMVLYLLSASVLSAYGVDALLKGAVGRRQLLTTAGLGMLLLLPLYYTMSRMLGPDAFGLLVNNLVRWSEGPYLRADVAQHIAMSILAGGALLALLSANRVPGSFVYGAVLILLLGDLFLMRGLGGQYFAAPLDLFRVPQADRVESGQISGTWEPWWLSEPVQERVHGRSGGGEFRVMGYARNGTLHFLSDFPGNLVPTLLPPNLAMAYGLEDLQGYNPLQLHRYAQYLAAVNGGPEDYHWAIVYNLQSPLLDLLNLRYVALRGDDARLRNVTIATGLNLETSVEATTVRPKGLLASGLQVHSYLGHSAGLEDGRVAARLMVVDSSGRRWGFDLRVGMETAEWAYDRPDVIQRVRHSKARVSMTWNLPSPVHTYVADIAFPEPIDIAQLTLERVEPDIFIVVPEVAAVPVRPLQRWERVGDFQGSKLFRNNLALPRYLLVPRAEVVDSPEAALERLQRADFDPRQVVILEGPERPQRQGDGEALGQVVVLARDTDGVRFAVQADSYGFLLLNELSYPGWNAYLDGRRTRVWRANYLFRAIEISPGEHEVEFRFEPDSLKLGLALSLPALALLLAAAVFHLKTRQMCKGRTPQ